VVQCIFRCSCEWHCTFESTVLCISRVDHNVEIKLANVLIMQNILRCQSAQEGLQNRYRYIQPSCYKLHACHKILAGQHNAKPRTYTVSRQWIIRAIDAHAGCRRWRCTVRGLKPPVVTTKQNNLHSPDQDGLPELAVLGDRAAVPAQQPPSHLSEAVDIRRSFYVNLCHTGGMHWPHA
jgi:hypothetical protein